VVKCLPFTSAIIFNSAWTAQAPQWKRLIGADNKLKRPEALLPASLDIATRV
jgi:hypothetical protein